MCGGEQNIVHLLRLAKQDPSSPSPAPRSLPLPPLMLIQLIRTCRRQLRALFFFIVRLMCDLVCPFKLNYIRNKTASSKKNKQVS